MAAANVTEDKKNPRADCTVSFDNIMAIKMPINALSHNVDQVQGGTNP